MTFNFSHVYLYILASTVIPAARAATDLAKDDIQVLSASGYGQSVSTTGAQGSSVFDLAECVEVSRTNYYATMDCTAQLEQLTGRPSLERTLVTGYLQGDGYINSSYYCRVLTVKTVLLADAASSPVFTGIGFYSSQGGGIRFIPKDDLIEVGTAHLKDGREVIIHEFVGTAICWQGSSTSSMRAQYKFKPYAAYDTGSESYNVWEGVADNHAISSQFSAWDRSADLLR